MKTNLIPCLALAATFLAAPNLQKALAAPDEAAANFPTEGKIVRLYEGPAPGSETWTHSEKESRTNLWHTRVVFNSAYNWTIKGSGVPADAPPMFVLAATDDPLGLAPQSVAIYQDWTAARKPAELHLFSKGGHGFGMKKQNLPTDHWIDRFTDWLDVQGLLKK